MSNLSKYPVFANISKYGILNLLFLPLMRNTIPRYELVETSIKMAKTIPDHAKREASIVATYAFSSKYLNEAERKKLLEVLKMCDLLERYVEDRFDEKFSEVAKSMLRDKCTVEFAARHTGLDIETVQRLKEELESE